MRFPWLDPGHVQARKSATKPAALVADQVAMIDSKVFAPLRKWYPYVETAKHRP